MVCKHRAMNSVFVVVKSAPIELMCMNACEPKVYGMQQAMYHHASGIISFGHEIPARKRKMSEDEMSSTSPDSRFRMNTLTQSEKKMTANRYGTSNSKISQIEPMCGRSKSRG